MESQYLRNEFKLKRMLNVCVNPQTFISRFARFRSEKKKQRQKFAKNCHILKIVQEQNNKSWAMIVAQMAEWCF